MVAEQATLIRQTFHRKITFPYRVQTLLLSYTAVTMVTLSPNLELDGVEGELTKRFFRKILHLYRGGEQGQLNS